MAYARPKPGNSRKYEKGEEFMVNLILSDKEVKRFRVEGIGYSGFYVDIVSSWSEDKMDGCFEAWLGHDDYGVTMFMFGFRASSTAEFMLLVKANLGNYIRVYKEMVEEE